MVFYKSIRAKKRAYALFLRRESNASFKVIADKCRILKSSAQGICSHQLLYTKKEIQQKKRTAQESIIKTQTNAVSNSEQNSSHECELYSETVNERKQIYHSAGM